jgi:hypothetical protein
MPRSGLGRKVAGFAGETSGWTVAIAMRPVKVRASLPRSNYYGELKMNSKPLRLLASLWLASALGLAAAPAGAQSAEVKDKPAIYTYVSNWVLPRSKWADMEKNNAGSQKALDADIAGGKLLAYGDEETLVHTEKGATHTGWWTGTSQAAVLGVLEEFYKSGSATNATFASATGHWDGLFQSRYYNLKSGTVKNGYDRCSYYKLKADAPQDAVDVLSKSVLVPFFEKLVSDGSVAAYQVATEVVHTQDASWFYVCAIMPNAQGLDKVNAALTADIGGNPLIGAVFGAWIDYSVHRDDLSRVTGVFK